MADTPTPAIPNEVQIDVNDNTTAYNHNISVRITDGCLLYTSDAADE